MFSLQDLEKALGSAMAKLAREKSGSSASDKKNGHRPDEPRPGTFWDTSDEAENVDPLQELPHMDWGSIPLEDEEEDFLKRLNMSRKNERGILDEMLDFLARFRDTVETVHGMAEPLSLDRKRKHPGDSVSSLPSLPSTSKSEESPVGRNWKTLAETIVNLQLRKENLVVQTAGRWDDCLDSLLKCNAIENTIRDLMIDLSIMSCYRASTQSLLQASSKPAASSESEEPKAKRRHLEGESATDISMDPHIRNGEKQSMEVPTTCDYRPNSQEVMDALHQGYLNEEELGVLKGAAKRFATSKRNLSALALAEALYSTQPHVQFKLREILAQKSSRMTCSTAVQPKTNPECSSVDQDDARNKSNFTSSVSASVDTLSPDLQLSSQFYVSDQDVESIGSEILQSKCVSLASKDQQNLEKERKSPAMTLSGAEGTSNFLDSNGSLTASVLRRISDWHLIAWSKYMIVHFPPMGYGTSPSLYVLQRFQMTKILQTPQPLVSSTRMMEVLVSQALNTLANLQNSPRDKTQAGQSEFVTLHQYVASLPMGGEKKVQLLGETYRSGKKEDESTMSPAQNGMAVIVGKSKPHDPSPQDQERGPKVQESLQTVEKSHQRPHKSTPACVHNLKELDPRSRPALQTNKENGYSDFIVQNVNGNTSSVIAEEQKKAVFAAAEFNRSSSDDRKLDDDSSESIRDLQDTMVHASNPELRQKPTASVQLPSTKASSLKIPNGSPRQFSLNQDQQLLSPCQSVPIMSESPDLSKDVSSSKWISDLSSQCMLSGLRPPNSTSVPLSTQELAALIHAARFCIQKVFISEE